MTTVGVVGVGHELPERVLSNDDIVALGIDTTDDWITERTGIKERRALLKDQATSDLAVKAAQKAIQNSGLDPQSIDLIVVGTSTPDYTGFPSVACIVQNKLNLREIPAFDLSAACTGFNYALTTAEQYIKSGMCKHPLVIGVDALSKIINWKDRSTCVLFGDGAGAAVLGSVSEENGILLSKLFANGAYADILTVKKNGARGALDNIHSKDEDPYIHMDGRAVFKLAIEKVTKTLDWGLQQVGLKESDIDYLILHQANLRIIKAIQERIQLEEEKIIVNLTKYGNTSAATIPIGLSELSGSGKLKSGDVIVLLGFGAGFTWGLNIIKWEAK